jgi:tetratricopeptide (TPR) repeat protein
MGIVLAYQSNLPQALESFKNARKLDSRNPIHYTNIAQIYIYQGELVKGRHWLGLGKRLGAPPVIVELNETLAAWRSGDLVEAEDLFETAYSLDPKQVNNWDEAPVADPIENFEDFTAYCCSNPSCGPHMEKGCRKLDLAVKEREVRDETLRKEMVLEMERRRKLQEIYRGRKDLEVEIEPPEPSDKPR